jgi:ferric-dicitrate binding protein FerR (iron transport regulator)
MDNLEDNYIHGVPTPEDLQQLRERLSHSTEKALEDSLSQRWQTETIETQDVPADALENIYVRLTRRLGLGSESQEPSQHKAGARALRWLQWAAIFLLPLTLGLSTYFYHQKEQLSAQSALITTGKDEKATVTLPDGTKVTLNAESQLRYEPTCFGKSERRVSFEGEAFFDVAKDKSRPFYVDADGLNVEVLGTKFNLQARKDEVLACLTLTQGTVKFTALANEQSVVLHAGQQVILDRRTNKLSVSTPQHLEDATAWQRGDMVFRNEPMDVVLQRLAKNYGVTLVVKKDVPLDEHFTGTLGNRNLIEDITILEYSNDLDISLANGRLIVGKRGVGE